jgi:hypothetical protein
VQWFKRLKVSNELGLAASHGNHSSKNIPREAPERFPGSLESAFTSETVKLPT